MTKKLTLLGLVVAMVAIAAFFYARNGNIPPIIDPRPAPSVVRVGYPALRISLPVFIAKEKGFFDKHRVNVELVRFDTAQPMMDALVGGSLDVGGYCALPITFSAMVRSKTPLVFISAIMEDDQHPISILLVKKNSGLTAINDLAGKRIGILPTRAYEIWLKKVLAANGVDPASVVIQQIPPPQQAAALASGSVDALFTNDPASTAAQALGAGENLLPGKAIVPETTAIQPFYFGSFNITKSFADAHPDIVRRISLALDEAIDFLIQNPDDAKKTMENYLPKEQHALITKFPDSLFKKTNETKQSDLDALLNYYVNEKILNAELDLTGAQFERHE
jgi:NitT/TauT family transport system substrate-binding protein